MDTQCRKKPTKHDNILYQDPEKLTNQENLLYQDPEDSSLNMSGLTIDNGSSETQINMNRSPVSNQPLFLHCLPREIRDKIYSILLADHHVLITYYKTTFQCRLIRLFHDLKGPRELLACHPVVQSLRDGKDLESIKNPKSIFGPFFAENDVQVASVLLRLMRGPAFSILEVNKQIYHEARDILYRENTFNVALDAIFKFLRARNPYQCRALGSIQFSVRIGSYQDSLNFQNGMRTAVAFLPNLRTLRFFITLSPAVAALSTFDGTTAPWVCGMRAWEGAGIKTCSVLLMEMERRTEAATQPVRLVELGAQLARVIRPVKTKAKGREAEGTDVSSKDHNTNKMGNDGDSAAGLKGRENKGPGGKNGGLGAHDKDVSSRQENAYEMVNDGDSPADLKSGENGGLGTHEDLSSKDKHTSEMGNHGDGIADLKGGHNRGPGVHDKDVSGKDKHTSEMGNDMDGTADLKGVENGGPDPHDKDTDEVTGDTAQPPDNTDKQPGHAKGGSGSGELRLRAGPFAREREPALEAAMLELLVERKEDELRELERKRARLHNDALAGLEVVVEADRSRRG